MEVAHRSGVTWCTFRSQALEILICFLLGAYVYGSLPNAAIRVILNGQIRAAGAGRGRGAAWCGRGEGAEDTRDTPG